MTLAIKLDNNIYFEILDIIHHTYSAVAADDENIPKSVVRSLSEQWVGEVDSRYNNIRESVEQKINQYAQYYVVTPQGDVDEFKYIYFSGYVIGNVLKEAKMDAQFILHWKAIIRLLDYRIFTVFGSHRHKLTRRIGKAIEEGNFEKHFGEYGVYLLYKCLYNSIIEVKAQKNLKEDSK